MDGYFHINTQVIPHPLEPCHLMNPRDPWDLSTPSRVLCTVLVTIRRARPPSLIEFHLINIRGVTNSYLTQLSFSWLAVRAIDL